MPQKGEMKIIEGDRRNLFVAIKKEYVILIKD